VHALQDRFGLHGVTAPPPAASTAPASPWPQYFAAAQGLLGSDPPTFTNGLDAFKRVREAGSGHDFSRAGYSSADAASIDAGVAQAAAIARSGSERSSFVEGWTYPRPNLGDFGDDFVFRAIIATSLLAALTPPEAMYMRAIGDGNGLFTGDGLYRLTLTNPSTRFGRSRCTKRRTMDASSSRRIRSLAIRSAIERRGSCADPTARSTYGSDAPIRAARGARIGCRHRKRDRSR
jgi:hypothetical protein